MPALLQQGVASSLAAAAAADVDEIDDGGGAGIDGFDEEDDEDDGDEDGYGADPSEMLLEASTMLYQLQNTWMEERRAEVAQLWRKLEGEYGFSIPEADSLQQDLLRGGSRRNASAPSSSERGGGGAEAEVAAGPDLSATTALSPTDSPVCNTSAILDRAADDLQVARALRNRLQEEQLLRRSQEAGSAPPTPSAVAGLIAGAEAKDEERLLDLRRQIQQLRDNEDRFSTQAGSGDRGIHGSDAGNGLGRELNRRLRFDLGEHDFQSDSPSLPSAAVPPSLLRSGDNGGGESSGRCGGANTLHLASAGSALDHWLEDLRLLGAVGGAATPLSLASPSSGGSSPSQASRLRPTGRASAAAPPLSRKAAARAAEAKALEWAASRGRAGVCSLSPAPASPSSAALQAQSQSPSGLRRTSTTSVAAIAAAPITTSVPAVLGGTATSASVAPAAAAPSDRGHGGGDEGEELDEAALMAKKLDEMLSELDEIDRIHSDICKITRQ